MMGKVTDHIIELIQKQVKESHLVVWFDPTGDYKQVVERLSIPDTHIVKYQGSFFALRYEIDQLMKNTEPPNLIIYVPCAEERTDNALIGYTKTGVVMKPGQSPWQRNTRLAVIAKHALKEIVGEDRISDIEKQVEDGSLKLSDLDKIAEVDGEVPDIISIKFGSKNISEVALKFINEAKYDKELEQKNVIDTLAKTLQTTYDIDSPKDISIGDYKKQVVRHLLMTAFLAELKGKTPEQFSLVTRARTSNAIDACKDLITTWRNRRDYHVEYVAWADKIEKGFGLNTIKFTLDQIVDCETFYTIEEKLQECVEQALIENASKDLVDIATKRKNGFWSENKHQSQVRWRIIELAGNVITTAQSIEQVLKSSPAHASAYIQKYTGGVSPWCVIDTYHRHMESQVQDYEDDEGRIHEHLRSLIIRAKQRYMSVGNLLAEDFIKTLKEDGYNNLNVLYQTQVYQEYVVPALKEGKTAYVLVDAFRYEMARELTGIIGNNFSINIYPAIASIPTVTEIGMASLMPKIEIGAKLGLDKSDKLGLEIDGKILTNRDSRLRYLEDNVEVQVYTVKMEELLSQAVSKNIEKSIADAKLIVVTSQEIDLAGESDSIPMARRYMDKIVRDLRRAFKNLTTWGVKTIVVSADHGFIFGEKLDSDTKIPSPGGKQIALHRRVWVGHGGANSPSFTRFSEKEIGLSGDMDVAVPNGFGAFRAGGSTSYFHQGASLQELVIPVLTVTSVTQDEEYPADFIWDIKLGSKKITSRVSSVQINANLKSISSINPPIVRIEARNKSGSISKPISAFYGFEEATGDVKLTYDEGSDRKIKTNTIIFSLAPEIKKDIVTIYLIDATSGKELKRIDNVEVSIAI